MAKQQLDTWLNTYEKQCLGDHSQVPHLETRAQAEDSMVHTTAQPMHSPPLIFAAHIPPRDWYPQKTEPAMDAGHGEGV